MRKRVTVLLMVVPTLTFAQSQDTYERDEVIKTFDTPIPKFNVKAGDGLGSMMDCVFKRKWEQSYHRDADGEVTEAFEPRQLQTPEQALDPSGMHKAMFWDYPDRDAQAQKLALNQNKNFTVASVGFSYPDFEPDLHTAIVFYDRTSQVFLASGRKDLPVGSNGMIKFAKHDGAWSFETVHLGTSN